MKLQSYSVSMLCCAAMAVLSSHGFAETAEITDEIIDNDDEQQTSQTGEWYLSSGEDPYGETSFYSNSSAQFTWSHLDLPNGTYDVYAWWTYHPNRSSMVPYRVRVSTSFGDEHSEYFVDQGDPNLGGQWNLLGTVSGWSRMGGPNINVTVSSENGQASADAVRFVYHSPDKEWPEIECTCDEYYSRAMTIYSSLGGKLVPYSGSDAESTVTCDIDNLRKDVVFTTNFLGDQAGQSVNLRVKTSWDQISESSECSARVSANFGPQGSIYSRIGGGDPRDVDVEACWASVIDLCTEN